MDAHLFRRFCDAILPSLDGARIEKIHAPAPDVLTLVWFNNGQRRQLCWRFGRKEPLAFVLPEPAAFGVQPTAQVMRLRKHCSGQRVRACVAQWASRRLWLMFPAQADGGTAALPWLCPWLCLDLREGPSLHFLDADNLPEEDTVLWPGAARLQEACDNWRDWPVLSPALRRTLAHLDLPDQWALLADLEAGGGDVFCYRDGNGQIRSLAAWPQPPAQTAGKGLQESVFDDPLPALEQAGREIVLARLARTADREAENRRNKERRKLKRLAQTLDDEQARLEAMCAHKANALALQENIWQWPRDLKCASVDVPEGGHGPARSIKLDVRFTVRENMARLFHTAERGSRGLAHLVGRRASLEQALRQLGQAAGLATGPASAGNGAAPNPNADANAPDAPNGASAPRVTLPQLPKRVQGFVSSDGFLLLRGRDSRGNLEARKLASPHDLWLHAANGPGAHVIIRKSFPGQEIPERTLDEAGCLAALKSWQQHSARAEITYCEVRHVKSMKNTPLGTVRMDKVWASREVAVDPAVEQRLLAKTGGVA